MVSLKINLFPVALLVLGLSACSGGGSGNTDGSAANDPETESPEANQQALTTPASEEDFLEQVKKKLKQSYAGGSSGYAGLVLGRAVEDDFESIGAVTESPASSDGADNISDTNTILAGVDESDYVKYDGRYLYSYQTGYAGGHWRNQLNVIDAQPESPTVLTSVDLGESSLVGMYLRTPDSSLADNKQIVAVSTDYSYTYAALDVIASSGDATTSSGNVATDDSDEITESYPAPNVAKTQVNLIDSLPLNPTVSQTLSLDGSLLASRMIDNRLVLVTGHIPSFYYQSGLLGRGSAEEDLAAIDALTAEDILPAYRLNDEQSRALTDSDNCFVLDREDSGYGTPQILTITTVDLDDTSSMTSTCTTSYAGAFFISRDSLLITDFVEGGTLIHKFALHETGASYRGSGEVSGYVRGGEYSFHLYEHNDRVFALSSVWESGSFKHLFTVLREDETNASALATVAQLPNDNQPETIGKPGEDIYGVRFFDDTAFVVTFERIDPLYAIDISDPSAPAIVGELELPGVSEYLHPISSDLLLGIGHNGQWPRELQVNLFDISDKAQPTLISQQKLADYQGAWTSLTYDHHAFASVTNGDQQWAKAAFPFSVYPQFLEDIVANPDDITADPDDTLEDADTTDAFANDVAPVEQNYLALLDIDKTNRVMTFPRVKAIEVEEPYSYYQRIIIDDEQLIFISNSKTEKLDWQ